MLEIKNLNVEYSRSGEIVHAVQNVSLSIGGGETVGVVGESGSGKSTLALAILRLIRPQEGRITSGQILFGGRDLLHAADEDMRRVRGRKIAMIFQDPFTSLNPVMRIRDQMAEVFNAHGLTDGPGDLNNAIEQVHMDPARVLEAYPHQLSGGQRQRVCIAMALLGKPDLLLADEPTTALDVIVQKDILDLLFRLQGELRLGMLLISHNLALVAQYTTRIAVMKSGRVVEEGSPTSIFRTPREAYTKELIASIPTLPGSR